MLPSPRRRIPSRSAVVSDDLGEPQTAVEGRDHLLRVRGGVDRVLRPFGDVDAAFDVDGAAAGALELALETQARGDSDALLQQRFVASELGKLARASKARRI